MKLSVIVATRNRMHAISGCLHTVAAAFQRAGLLDAEIVVVDNGSTDDTAAVVRAWANASGVPVQLLCEPRRGVSRARNRAMRHARGDLFVLTDDDCRLDRDYVSQLLARDAADGDLVLRGGHVRQGDPADLPLTVTAAAFKRWNRENHPPIDENIGAFLLGCNLTMRRSVAERVGPFDVRFGPGGAIASGEDHEYVFRAYCAGVTIEAVPDMAVVHFHGRKTPREGSLLMRNYMVGSGAIYAKYLFRSPGLCRQIYWDCKTAAKEIATGTNLFLPDIGFSARDKLACYARGAARYMRHGRNPVDA